MNCRKLLVLAAATITLLAGTTLPASAADTATTFTLTGGALTLSMGTTAALANEASGVAANTITGTLGAVTVTDARGLIEDWDASASSTAFMGASGTPSESTNVFYSIPGAVTTTGTSDAVAVSNGAVQSIMSATSVVTAAAVSGNNTASWVPTLDVLMPGGALADDYSGTVTTSVL